METPRAVSRGKKVSRITQSYVLIGLIVALSVVATIVNPRFISINNIINVFQQIAVLGIVASGVGMLLVAGEIDISVGTQVSLIGVVLAFIIQTVTHIPAGSPGAWLTPFAIPLAVLAAFVLGALLGAINGITVIKSRAASFIITLGFSTVYSGISLIATGGGAYVLLGKFSTLGRGKILNILPVAIPIFIGVILISFVILKYTKYGRFLYAIGGNRKAAFVSGINTVRVTLTAFIVVGILDALAALILISQIGSALANSGDTYSLDALAAVIVGGMSLTGGRGTALSIFLGVVLIGLISNSLVIMQVNPFLRNVVIGAIIIVAVTAAQYSAERE